MLPAMDEIRPFEVMEAFREAEMLSRQGKGVIHLSLGQPSGKMPDIVQQRLMEHIAGRPMGYTNACGTPELRARIARHYREHYGLEISESRIFITVGSSSAFMLSILTALEMGSNIGIGRPYYPAYPNMLRALHMKPQIIETMPEERFHLTWDRVASLKEKPKAVIVASPANPTGSMLTRDEVKALAEGCEKNGIRFFSDEIYHHVTFGEKAASALEFSDEAIVINSFSKYYLLSGWRLGWVVMPEKLARKFELMAQSFFISPPEASQIAALYMMDAEVVLNAEVERYHANRDLLSKGLREAGITEFNQPEGAFYLYADVSQHSNDSKDFCYRMLHEAGVCAVPGIDFDEVNGHRYMRFSYCGSQGDVEEASKRIKNWLR